MNPRQAVIQPDPFTLRVATSADISAMHALLLSVTENRLSDASRVTAAHYLDYLGQPGACWVAEADGRMAGFAIADLPARSIWALFVSPACERRGIGRALLAQVTDRLLRSGSGSISLVTAPGTRAERLYLAAGWVKCGIQENGKLRFERVAQQ